MSLHKEEILNTSRLTDHKKQNKFQKVRLNVHNLNRRLNENKKTDFFKNFILISISLSALAIIMVISFKF